MKTVAHTMETLDNTLDTVDELIQALPIPNDHKRRLCEQVYSLWMDVEESVELIPTDFPT